MRSRCWGGDWPVTQVFGVNPAAYARFGLAGHNGIDIGCWNGTPLYAADAGECVVVWTDPPGYGQYVRLRCDDGSEWVYAHLQSFAVRAGQRVARGALLGASDNTGNSTGPHLHLGYRPPGWETNRGNGYDGYVDPAPKLAQMAAEDAQAGEEDMALVAELEAKVAELVSTNSALNDQVRDLRAEVDGQRGVITDLNGQLEAVRATLAERDSALGALNAHVIPQFEQRLAAMEEALREAVAGAAARRLSSVVVRYADGTEETASAA